MAFSYETRMHYSHRLGMALRSRNCSIVHTKSNDDNGTISLNGYCIPYCYAFCMWRNNVLRHRRITNMGLEKVAILKAFFINL